MRLGVAVAVAVAWVLIFWASAGAEERKLNVLLGVAEEYNDNIFFSFEDKIDDFITTVSGGLKAGLKNERGNIDLSGRLDSLYYNDNDELDDVDQFYTGSVGYALTDRLKVLLDADFSRDSRPDRDINLTGLVLGTAIREKQQYGIASDFALTDISRAGLSYRYNQEEFDKSELTDFHYHQAGLRFSHRLDKHFLNTTGRLNLNFATYDYTETKTDYYGATIGVQKEVTELWRLLVDLGVRYTDSEFETIEGERTNEDWGAVEVIEFSYHGEYLATSISFSHDIGTAGGRQGSVQRTSVVFIASYALARDWQIGLSAGYFINLADEGGLAVSEIDEETANLRPWLRFLLTDWLALEASYTHSRLDDNVANDTAYRNLYLLELGVDYPVLE